MSAFNKQYPLILFVGDILIFFGSLWITLVVRYQALPSYETWLNHVIPFSLLFVVWFLVFYIAGLYEKRAIILKSRLPISILRVQITNSVIAVLFFYFIPYFNITPKTNLFIYLVVSFAFVLLWRLYGYLLLSKKRSQNALLIASGVEMKELRQEVNSNNNYEVTFDSLLDLHDSTQDNVLSTVADIIKSKDISIVVVDFTDQKIEPVLPALYNLIFNNVIFIDMHEMYEDVFDRIPLTLISYGWFLENISLAPKVAYDFLKRLMDIAVSIPLGLVSLIVYPFIILAIKLNDRGPIFISQERIGKGNKHIHIYKFRSMSRNDTDLSSTAKHDNQVTKVGAFLRVTRLDELPQLWNVVRGDLSLIGPRPELPKGVSYYEQEIPYYGIRHMIKPGLSGWAQLYHDNHPHHSLAVEMTKEKLSYDLYYLKNRSFLLDLKIALKTIKKLLSRSGI